MPSCGPVRPSRRSRWRAASLIGVHLVIAGHLTHWWLAGRTVTPVEPSEAMQTLETGLLNAGFVFFVASLLLTLVLGRFFCGWACHIVALQDLCAWLLARARLKPKPVRSRLLALVPLGAGLYMFVWPTVRRWVAGAPAPELHLHLTTTDFWATFPGPAMAVFTFLVVGFVVVWWLGAKGFCTYGCPYGGFYAVADRFAPGRILVNDNCDGCAHCTAVCTSNVRVHEEVRDFKMVIDAGCMKCMDCVSSCPKDALRFGFAKPALTRAPRRTFDFTWGEEIALAAVFALAFFAWRGLYASVPLLLSFALAVLTATAALLLWRLARRSQVAWQHLLLKRQGSLTRAGRVAAAVAALWLAVAAHGGVVQWSTWRGHELLNQAMQAAGAAQDDLAAASLAHLRRAAGLGVAVDHRVELDLAQHASRAGDLATVEAHLRRAAAAKPRDERAALMLANVVAARGPHRLAEAEAMLVALLERNPQHEGARASLAVVRASRQRSR